WQTRGLRDGHDGEAAERGDQEEEQGWAGGEAVPDQEPHVGVCQLSGGQPDVRLPDQGEHDAAGQELQVMKSGITEAVLSWAKFKAQTQLEKVGGKKKTKLKGVAKLEDANEAGGKNAHRCTLILTEGDSAKSLAVSGLGVVGRDHYGVFPLRGKLLNVREASHKQIMENIEINNIIKIVGLQYKKKYNRLGTSTSKEAKEYFEDMARHRIKFKYSGDQDDTNIRMDGSHIKGLVINFLHHNWPELLRLPFLEEFITPIVKASKKNISLSFYSIPEFEEWKKNTANHHTYNIKYYK
ncbi:hypothetical protein B566_EDAN018848, partial [Ephemera danica]